MPPRLGGLCVTDNLINRAFDFKKTCLGITVQRAKLSNPLNASIGGKEDADRINLQPQDFFDQLSDKARAKQHSTNDNVKQILNACHALITVHK